MSAGEGYSRENWQGMWQTGDTPWAGEKVNDPFFAAFDRLLSLYDKPADNLRALVPLCGNSSAVRFLYDRGCAVTAVDYVPEAIDSLRKTLFSDIEMEQSSGIETSVFRAPRLELIVHDFFSFSTDEKFDLIYDRGGFVAVPPSMQRDYARVAARVAKPGALIFLRCAEFVGVEFQGPPFSVGDTEVKQMFVQFELIDEEKEELVPTQDRFVEAGVKKSIFRNLILRRLAG